MALCVNKEIEMLKVNAKPTRVLASEKQMSLTVVVKVPVKIHNYRKIHI